MELHEHLVRLGYDSVGVEYVLSDLRRVCANFFDKETAFKYVSESICKYVARPFGEKEFKIFLRGIDPLNISERELSWKLGLDYFEDVMYPFVPDWYITKHARDSHGSHSTAEERYRREIKRKLFSTKRSSIKRIFDSVARDIEWLRSEGRYGILTSHHYRESKDSGLPESESLSIHFISVPMGGMPGYKIKRRRS